jgi:lincosamide nucleotidyltransferase A/C/D/E
VRPRRPSEILGGCLKSGMRFPAESVIQIFRHLEENGVPVWLDGGWAADALLKRETREHLDLDLIVPIERLNVAETVLRNVGFVKDHYQTQMPIRLVLRNSQELQIDIHPVTVKPDGSAEHIYLDQETQDLCTFVHSVAGLSGVGMINGRIVRCTTAYEQIRQKTERHYSPWDQSRMRASGLSADLEDIISLEQEFGIHEHKLTRATISSEMRPTNNIVINAAEQFCLHRMVQLNAQHSQLTAQHTQLSAQYTQLTAQYTQLTAQHTQLTAQHAQLAAQLNAMLASTSWRLTGPLRWTVRWFRVLTNTLHATHGYK